MSEAKARPARTYRLNPREADSGPDKAAGPLIVEVALNVPRLGALTYRVPEELADKLVPGMRVMVPLGRRRMTGYVAALPGPLPPGGPDPKTLKDVIRALDDEPALTEELIGLTRWVADYYCCGWGEAIRAALPGVGERKSVERVRLTDAGRREAALEAAGLGLPGMGGEKDAPLRARVLNALKARPMKLDALAKDAGRGGRQEAERLIGEGLIEKVSLDEGGAAPALVRYVRLAAAPDAKEREYLDRRAPKVGVRGLSTGRLGLRPRQLPHVLDRRAPKAGVRGLSTGRLGLHPRQLPRVLEYALQLRRLRCPEEHGQLFVLLRWRRLALPLLPVPRCRPDCTAARCCSSTPARRCSCSLVGEPAALGGRRPLSLLLRRRRHLVAAAGAGGGRLRSLPSS